MNDIHHTWSQTSDEKMYEKLRSNIPLKLKKIFKFIIRII